MAPMLDVETVDYIVGKWLVRLPEKVTQDEYDFLVEWLGLVMRAHKRRIAESPRPQSE